MFDITTLSAAETSTVELLGGDDAPLYDDKGKPLSITVYGPGTKVYQRAQARQQNQLMDKIKKRGKMDQSAEDKLTEQAEFLAACGRCFPDSAPPAILPPVPSRLVLPDLNSPQEASDGLACRFWHV